MGLLDTAIQQDAIFNTDNDLTPGVEAVTVKNYVGGGTNTRSINVHVRRMPFEEGDRAGQLAIFVGIVWSATYGLLVSEVNPGATQVQLSIVPGESAQWLTLHYVKPEDPINEPFNPAMGWWRAG